jgi:DNA polymerase V
MEVLDGLNRKFGRETVSVASAAHQAANTSHAAKQERRSPRYTTRLDEIPVARA